MEVLTLPPKTRKLIDRYLNLNIAGKKIVCPYYQNILRKTKPPVYSGKGRPDELEREISKLIKKKPNIAKINYDALRLTLVEIGLGIDCSGFVTNILNQFFIETIKQNLFDIIDKSNFSWRRKLVFKLRPRTNLSANILTSPPVSKTISLNQIRPGDLFKLGKGHVAIITQVWKENKKTKKFEYTHSTSDYGIEYGVRKGGIIINQPNQPLENQNWTEVFQAKNWTKNDYLKASPTNRGFRKINKR